MRVFNQEVFNNQVDNTEVFVDSKTITALLGSAEKIQYQYIGTGASGTTPTLVINRYKSNDNVNWSTGTQLVNQQITLGTTLLGLVLDAYPSDAPTAYIRIGVKVTGTSATANIRIIACGRGEQAGA